MPREQVQWFAKESVHNSDQVHAKQSCTYYSIVNVNKSKYPFLSSYEKEQTWTLTRTISNNHKRYQSSIENIHLTVPTPALKSKRVDYENIQIKSNPANALPAPSPALEKYTSSTSLQPAPLKSNSNVHHGKRERKTVPIKTVIYENSKQKSSLPGKTSRPFSKPMRVIHSNGEFVVRI